MFSTAVFFCTIFNIVATQIYTPAQNVDYNGYETKYAPQYTNYRPKDYAFQYGVSDPKTGDHKSQWEKRENGVTVGMYSLLEPDGSKRIVEYVADKLHGFRALVKKIPINPHQLPIVYRAGYNIDPNKNEDTNANIKDEKENTHEAIASKPNESAEEDDDDEYEKQEEDPVNKETEEVNPHHKENDEESEDAGYTEDDHEDEKNEDDEELSSYKSYDDEEEEED